MPETMEIRVPDIGDVEAVEVIEVLVTPGDRVEAEQPLVTLESDKASMDVPSPHAGVIRAVEVAVGNQVSVGSLLVRLEPADAEPTAPASATPQTVESNELEASPVERPQAPQPAAAGVGTASAAPEDSVDVVVLGAGPGGYSAAFRAADLGLRTVLVERYPTLGGVCLNVGCIPSKALLHSAGVIAAAQMMSDHGVVFAPPKIDLPKLAEWKNAVVGQLTGGLAGLARQREIEVVHGTGQFESAHRMRVEISSGSGAEEERFIDFRHAIIAAGSQATQIPGFPNGDPRVMDSTDALDLERVPKRMLIIGGGIIGLEMATVYHALGSRISVVELLDGLMPGCDPDLVGPLQRRIEKQYEAIHLGTRVVSVTPLKRDLKVTMERGEAGLGGSPKRFEERFDAVLVAVGRRPNGHCIGAERAGVRVDENGFIAADRQQRTNVNHIFSIGDIAGQPMLAHKATHEGKVAAEVAAGHKSGFDAMTIPSVAYTDPEVAWTGVTEQEAKARAMDFDKATFPWAASGRSLAMGRNEGLTKVLFDKQSGRLIGTGIVGPHAGDLIAEATLAIEMGAVAADIALTIHPHPTLSETFNFAAEMVEGTITDLYLPKKR